MRARNLLGVLIGIVGSGKTCFLSRLLNQPLPEVYTRAGIAESPVASLLSPIGSLSFRPWELFSRQDNLHFLASLFRKESKLAVDTSQPTRRVSSPTLPKKSTSPTSPSGIQSGSSKRRFSTPPVVHHTKQPRLNSATSKSLLKLVKSPESSSQATDGALEVMQMVEIGSQGVFMGSMLHQVRNSQLVILVLDLTQGVDEYPSTHTKKKE